MVLSYLFELFFVSVVLCFATAELLSSAISVAGGFIISAGYATWSYNCFYNECCNDRWINYKPTDLENYLKNDLYGQHLVSSLIPRTVKGFLEKEPKKPLVMSFHGPTGCGKNHVSKMIANSLYKMGMQSKYVHLYIANRDFPHKTEVAKYQKRLRSEIAEYTKLCGRSLFIFDEVDKMPPGVLDAVKPYLDYHEKIEDVDYRKNIFIFLSNDGGNRILEIALDFWKDGREREDITMKNIEPLIRKGVFNERGGFQFSEVIRSELIDAYIPFLPLEKKHVKKCVISELKSRNLTESEASVLSIADELEYVPEEYPLYSVSGCKRIPQKVDVFLVDDD